MPRPPIDPIEPIEPVPPTPIDIKFAALGGAAGFLGAPDSPTETATPDGFGRYRHFARGSIHWSPRSGAHEIHGLIRSKWAELGWERGFLGYPVSDELPTTDGAGRYNRFQHGLI